MNKAQVEGHIEETKGQVKEWAAKLVDSKSTEQEGNALKYVGKTQADHGDENESAEAPRPPKAQGAMALLRADHKIVRELFAEYGKTSVKSRKKTLVSQICEELTIHAQVEEEIFYPAVKEVLKDKALVPEAIVEHASLKELIEQVDGVEPDGEIFDAKIKVLSEYVKHHVKEEQNEIFPQAKGTGVDMLQLGARIASRKAELIEARVRPA